MAIGDLSLLYNTTVNGLYDAPSAAQAAQAQQEHMAELMRQAQNVNWPVRPAPSESAPTLHQRAREMFLKRLGGIRAEHKIKLGDFVATHVHGTTVYLFYVFDGREGVVKEDIDLFPSDMLITQFRMLLA